MSIHPESGVREAVMQAFHQLPRVGVVQALQVIAEHVPAITSGSNQLFPGAPVRIVSSPLFMPMMRVVSERLNQFFSGEVGRNALVVLLAIGKKNLVVGQETTADGQNEFGIDCHGPYRRFFPKVVRFRPKKKPVLSRASFEELCFFADDPKEVYRSVFQLLAIATNYLLGKKEGKS